MNARKENEPAVTKGLTTTERKSERELVVTRTIDAPARIVFEAWTKAELFQRWWVPKSLGLSLLSCELDVRVGGTYRLVFKHPAGLEPMAFHGRYLEVIPYARLVWTNEEAGDDGQVTTVSFEERDGKTLLVISDLYPSKDALDQAIASGSTGWADETFDQLDDFLAGAEASDPQDLERLLVARENAGDVDGMTALFEQDAVIQLDDGKLVRGKDAIHAFFVEIQRTGYGLEKRRFQLGEQRPALVCGDLALTSVRSRDGNVTSEVARRQDDGTWLWVIDRYSVNWS